MAEHTFDVLRSSVNSVPVRHIYASNQNILLRNSSGDKLSLRWHQREFSTTMFLGLEKV
jgi:hypothetical protein